MRPFVELRISSRTSEYDLLALYTPRMLVLPSGNSCLAILACMICCHSILCIHSRAFVNRHQRVMFTSLTYLHLELVCVFGSQVRMTLYEVPSEKLRVPDVSFADFKVRASVQHAIARLHSWIMLEYVLVCVR